MTTVWALFVTLLIREDSQKYEQASVHLYASTLRFRMFSLQVDSAFCMSCIGKLIEQGKIFDHMGRLHPLQVGVKGVWIARDVHNVLELCQQLIGVFIATCKGDVLSGKNVVHLDGLGQLSAR